MKNSIKRLSLALLVLGITSPVLADTCSPFDVTVPNQQGGLTFGADALYMRGTAPDLGYAVTFASPVPTPIGGFTTTANLSTVNTSYQWGYDVSLGYRFPGTGADLTATWTHLGNFDDSDSTTTPYNLANVVTGTFQQSGSVEFNYDAVDLDLGQRVNFGDYFQFRMFAGGRWADIKEDRSNSYPEAFNPVEGTDFTVGFDENINSDFRGLGPQLGFDGRYCLGYGFGIDAGLTASLLVGDVDADNNTFTATTAQTVIGPVLVSSAAEKISQNDLDRVVPALDANLGLDYTVAFANCDRSYLTVQAGYKAISYFGAGQNTFEHTPATDNVGFTTTSTLGNGNNITFDGPYAGVKVNL